MSIFFFVVVQELLNVRASKETLETSYSELSHRLSSLEGAGERHDLLDMELETAEHRIEELSAQITEAEKKLTKAEEEIEHERALKAKAEEAVRDLEQSLQREQDRAEEFKVRQSYDTEQTCIPGQTFVIDIYKYYVYVRRYMDSHLNKLCSQN